MTEELPPGYATTTDPAAIDLGLVHGYLSEQSYWAKNVPRAVVETAIANSLCFVLTGPDGRQAGFGRVVTDRATFAYLADVFVLPEHAGKGVGKGLIATIRAHPALQDLRRFLLATRDAHGFYARFGFTPLEKPDWLMEILDLENYTRR